VKRFIALFTLLVATSAAVQGAGPDTRWVGVLWTKGAVSVGGAYVPSGTTVVPGDVITTAPDGSAWLRFRTPASTSLLANTQVVLLADNSTPSLLLRKGKVVVDQKVAEPVQVAVPGGYVLVKGDTQTGAECELATADAGAMVSVKRGVAEVHTQGTPVILHAGQSARVGAGPQGGEQVAGKVSREIPEGVVQRAGQAEELPLQLNLVINWNDLVRTLDRGRTQIMLLDGTTLNVGSRSELRVLKHIPEAQQTQVEVPDGKVEASVPKITSPNGKFELHTKSAVVKTLDTAFVSSSDDKGTRVCGVDGVIEVRSADPNIAKVVTLRKNECTYVPVGGPPADPTLAPGVLSSLLSAVSISGGAAGAPGGLGLSSGTIIGIAAAAGAGAIIAAVVLSGGGTTTPTTP